MMYASENTWAQRAQRLPETWIRLAPYRNDVASNVRSGLATCHGTPCAGGEVLLGSTRVFGCEQPSWARWVTPNPDETCLSHWSCFWPRQSGNGEHASRCWGYQESQFRTVVTNLSDLQRRFVLLRFLLWPTAERWGWWGCRFTAATAWSLTANAKLPFWRQLTPTAGIFRLWWHWQKTSHIYQMGLGGANGAVLDCRLKWFSNVYTSSAARACYRCFSGSWSQFIFRIRLTSMTFASRLNNGWKHGIALGSHHSATCIRWVSLERAADE